MSGLQVHKSNSLVGVSSDVIAANVEIYRTQGKSYDNMWCFSFGGTLDPALEQDLDRITANFADSSEPLRCLDCGAGTGAVTLNMLERGWLVTALDVSPDMLNLLRDKVAGRKLNGATLVNEPAEEFLARPGRDYHLITFNSVLHHFYKYSAVVRLAAERLVAGGFLYSNVDPVIPSHPALTSLFDSFETVFVKLLHDRSDLIPGTMRRVRKFLGKTDAVYRRKVASAGDLAEFHARRGVDDLELIQVLKEEGMSIVEHSRYPLARTTVGKYINGHLRLREDFKIIARKDAESGGQTSRHL